MPRNWPYAVLSGVAMCTSAMLAHAQPYPSKPIRVVVRFALGGTSDILSRSIGQALQIVEWAKGVKGVKDSGAKLD